MTRATLIPCLLAAAAFGCGALQTAPTAAEPEGAAEETAEPAPAAESAVAPSPVPEPKPPSPVAPEPPQPAVKTRDRMINVGAKCAAAESAYGDIRVSTAKLGLSPHPDISTAFQRMKLALQSAERELAAGDEASARESLDIAEAAANKVLRAAGGN